MAKAPRADRTAPSSGRTPDGPRRRGCFARVLFALVALPVLGATLAGLAAAYADGAWAAQILAIGLPYAAGAAAALALVALATRRRGWALALAVPALAVGVRAWPGAAHTTGPADLVLTSFNVPQGYSREALGDSMAAFAARTQPHLLAMQDTWVYPAGKRADQAVHVRALVERGPYRLAAPARLQPRDGWRSNGLGTPLLVRTAAQTADSAGAADQARVEVLDQEEVDLGRTDDEVSLALRTRFRWRGREAVLYNVHLRSYGEPKPWTDPAVDLFRPATWRPYLRRYRTVFARRHAEADRLAGRIAAETLPVIVAGDFNSTADHYTARRLRHALDGAPLVDVYRRAAGWRWGRSYHAGRPLVRIDFVLADPDAFEVAGARTHAVGFSDHRPVEVHLRWRDEPAPDSSGSGRRGGRP